jgi:uncharacterized repeat protein (TIGR02543 family)
MKNNKNFSIFSLFFPMLLLIFSACYDFSPDFDNDNHTNTDGNSWNGESEYTENSALITLSGTISVTYEGQIVPCVQIGCQRNSSLYITDLYSPGANAAWSITIPAFNSQSKVSLQVTGYSSKNKKDQCFYEYLSSPVINAYKTDVADINIDMGNIFTIYECNINFYSNGGRGTVPSSITVKTGDNITLPDGKGLIKDGYVFGGWSAYYADSYEIYDGGSSYTVMSRYISFYAKWIPLYTVTFYSNGGRGTVPASITVASGTDITIPSGDGLTKDGYVFGGWDGVYNAGDTYTVTYDTGLYATWIPVYTVTFNSNGGSGTVPSISAVEGNSIILPDGKELTKSGYYFSGWINSGNTISYSAGSSIVVNGDITLYARWDTNAPGSEGNPISLTAKVWADGSISSSYYGSAVWYSFDVTKGTDYYVWWNDGFSGDGTKSLKVQVSAYLNGSSAAITNFSDLIYGWDSFKYFTASSNGTVKLKVIPYENGSTGTFAVVYSTNYYRPGRYTVKFDANGGSGTVPSITDYSETIISIPGGENLTRAGYDFDNWKDSLSSSPTPRYYNAGASYLITGDITMYAVWRIIYTVNYDINGGSGTPPSSKTTSLYFRLPGDEGFTRNGYTFICWNTEADGTGTNYNKDSLNNFGRDITLYAIWKPIYTVTFNINGGSGTVPPDKSAFYNSSYEVYLPGGSAFSNGDSAFGGWNTKADGTGTNYSAESRCTISGNITLYAKWYALGSEANPIPLTADTWANGEINSANSELWYILNVTGGNTYNVWWNESGCSGNYTLDVKVSAYLNGSSAAISGFSDINSAWNTPKMFTPNSSGTVKLKVVPYTAGKTGTFTVAYSANNTRPSNLCTITFNANGGNGTVPSPVTAYSGTSIILPNGNGLTRNGYTFGGWSTGANGAGKYNVGNSYTVPSDNTVLYAYWNPPGSEGNPLPLTANTWKDSEIYASTQEDWYSFNVTSGNTYYVWWNDNSEGYTDSKKGDVAVSARYANSSVFIFGGTDIQVDKGWSTAQSFTANQTGTVYIRVIPYNRANRSIGNYSIVYSTSDTRPPVK